MDLGNKIVFTATSSSEPLMVLSDKGMLYRGKMVEDAGEAHAAFMSVMKQMQEAHATAPAVWARCASGVEAGCECIPEIGCNAEDAAPAPVAQGEPVWLVATGETHNGRETYTRHDERPPLCDAERLYTAAPAPVAQGEPCSDKRLTLIASRCGLHALTGKDRADMLAFGRACMADALAAPAPVAQRAELDRFLALAKDAGFKTIHDVPGLIDALKATEAPAPVAQHADDPDSWEANAQYLLDKCPFAVRQREGGGSEDLKASLVVTFQGMQMRLQGHPMFAKPAPAPVLTSAQPLSEAAINATISRHEVYQYHPGALLEFVRAVERACAEAWGVKLATGQEGGKS